jgi:hypothetical protein
VQSHSSVVCPLVLFSCSRGQVGVIAMRACVLLYMKRHL